MIKPEILENAKKVVPTKRQLLWQETGFYGLFSFGMNTFTDSEFGSGGESPELFDPGDFNIRLWAKAAKMSGMNGVLLTVKHYDGFCLWPSEYTNHTVKSSPWKNGEGDLVGELATACRENGLKFGIFIALWDKHDLRYGTGEEYDKFFKNQLRELLTNYGDIFMVWLDNTCVPTRNGRRQSHDMQGIYDFIRELQPDAVIGGAGPDVRFSGNYVGVCRKAEWSVVPYYYAPNSLRDGDVKPPRRISFTDLDLGSRKKIKKGHRLIWYPAEVALPMRKGWFYHEYEMYDAKPLSKIVDTWYNTVGGNACFMLGISPDKNGKIPPQDAETMLSVGAQLQIDFNEDLALDSLMTASSQEDGFGAENVIKEDRELYWKSSKGDEKPWIMIDLTDDYDIDKVVITEHIASGQHVEEFTLYGKVNGEWMKLSEGTVIGYKRICRFPEVRVQYMKLVIDKSRGPVSVERLEAY